VSDAAEFETMLTPIKGDLREILTEIKGFRREMDEMKARRVAHDEENRKDFIGCHARLSKLRGDMDERFTDQTQDRQRHLEEQDVKLDSLLRDRNFARGAGWVIIGIIAFLGAIVTHIGDAVLAALHIKIG
jgi:hypothetical protein